MFKRLSAPSFCYSHAWEVPRFGRKVGDLARKTDTEFGRGVWFRTAKVLDHARERLADRLLRNTAHMSHSTPLFNAENSPRERFRSGFRSRRSARNSRREWGVWGCVSRLCSPEAPPPSALPRAEPCPQPHTPQPMLPILSAAVPREIRRRESGWAHGGALTERICSCKSHTRTRTRVRERLPEPAPRST
eukprot:COSAG04_NODE_2669_length_3757_cov_4.647348_2_plen_190_part_00